MDKVIELAFATAGGMLSYDGEGEPRLTGKELHTFYTLARADLEAEIAGLHITMMAAAVEIQEQWEHHCDEEGYGPANLMHRLERGINGQYGYDAKTIVRMDKRIEDLEAENAKLTETIKSLNRALTNTSRGNAKLKEMYALLASAWFYGGWEAETHNERLMQKLMQEAGYWPTTEEEIVARAALGEK